MWIRYKTDTLAITHVSEPKFTSVPGTGEADTKIVAKKVPMGSRLKSTLKSIEPDPDYVKAKKEEERIYTLIRTDSGLSRVLEDLIDLLVTKKIITNLELPQPAKDKLTERKSLRNQGV